MKREPNQTRKEFGEGLRYHPHNGVLKPDENLRDLCEVGPTRRVKREKLCV